MSTNKHYVKPLHRIPSESETKELAKLISQYLEFNPLATPEEVNNSIVALAELYDEALKLRYAQR